MSNVLIVGAAWVGDAILSQPLLVHLRTHPDVHRLDVLAPNWTHGVLQRMPEVDQILDLPFRHGELNLAGRWRSAQDLRRTRYDQAIILPNSLKSALIPWMMRIPIRTGFLGEQRWGLLNDIRRLDAQQLPLMGQRFLALGHPHSSPPPEASAPRLLTNPANQAQLCAALGLNRDRPVAIFCPGAEYGSAKRWPIQHFAQVGHAWIAEGWQVWIMGSPRDQEIGAALAAQLPAAFCHLLCGTTTLADAVDLMAMAQRVVTNDSGLMHMAAALDRPMAALFGSSSPQFTPPLSHAAQVFRLNLPCSPCFKRECPLGHRNCLEQLLPTALIAHFATANAKEIQATDLSPP